MTSIKDEVVL